MKVCDLTQFYSPVSGGVKRYVSEKVRHLREHRPGDEHVLIIPGERDEVRAEAQSRVYTIRSPLLAETSGYRILLRLEALERILEAERPDVIESGDPYQVGWRAATVGQALRIPTVGFYHSHFPEAYVRLAGKYVGGAGTSLLMEFSRRYVRRLYNRYDCAFVPSPALGEVLREWGVRNVTPVDLGVDTRIFVPKAGESADVRAKLGVPKGCTLLMYAGRLAQEKNTQTLAAAFRLLHRDHPGRFHLLMIGDGLQRPSIEALRRDTGAVTWLPYCPDASKLASFYRAADLFVHPGVQETFGFVTLEAQACGTPVVGIRGSYMDRIIFTDQDSWAAENSPQALSEAIVRSSSRNLKAQGAEISERVAARYSWPQVFRRLFDVYAQVIADSRQPNP